MSSSASTPIVVSKTARGRPSDSPDVRISKTLSYILRHGAEKEGLKMRPDGYIRVTELLARPKLKGVDLVTIQRLVAENDKQRYQLLFEPDPIAVETPQTEAAAVWWIRANQGHTLEVKELELKDITDPDELPVAVHGTSRKAWESIEKQGLSRMLRNHIHLATGLPSSGVKSGMRPNSQVLIYIDVPKAMSAGYKFHLSSNGVILCEGNEKGFIPPEFFKQVDFPSAAKEHGSRGPVKRRSGDGANGTTQGMSVQVKELESKPIVSPEELPVAVHGTSRKAWESIEKEGLSRMLRHHIHLATGLPSPGIKNGMRPNSQVLIYISVPKAMSEGLKFHLSSDGTILCEGDERGFIPPEFFEKVEFPSVVKERGALRKARREGKGKETGGLKGEGGEGGTDGSEKAGGA